MKKSERMNNKNIALFAGAIIIILVALIMFLFKQDIYKFNFADGYTPGNTYKGKINLDNGKVDFTIIRGCSLIDREECPENTTVKGTLTKEQLELVKTALDKNNRKDNPSLLIGVSYLIKGDSICDEETNETCEESGKQLIEYSNQ